MKTVYVTLIIGDPNKGVGPIMDWVATLPFVDLGVLMAEVSNIRPTEESVKAMYDEAYRDAVEGIGKD